MLRKRIRTLLSLFLPLLLASVLLVACDAGEDEVGGGGGLTEGDLTADAPLDDQAALEQNMVVLVSDLLSINIEDELGTDVGIISEILVDDSGAIQYLIVDAAFVDEPVGADAADDDIVEVNAFTVYDADADGLVSEEEFNTTLQTAAVEDVGFFDTYDVDDDGFLDRDEFDMFMSEEGFADTDLYADAGPVGVTSAPLGNTIALPWSAVEARSALLTDAGVEDRPFEIVYVDETPLTEQPTFNALILEERGAVLDDLAIAEDEAEIPADYSYLIQASEFDEVDFGNTAGEEIGEIEDALVDIAQGSVRYVIVDVGGFLGIGERTVAVPYGAFQIDVTAELGEEEEIVALDVDETTLENAPEFPEEDWTPAVDAGWDDEWSSYWENELDMEFNGVDDV